MLSSLEERRSRKLCLLDSLEISSNLSCALRDRSHYYRYVGVGRPTEPEEEGDAAGMRVADGTTEAGANGGGAAGSAVEESGKVARGKCLSVAECSPVRAWAYLLGALPKVHTYMKMLECDKE